MSEAIQVLRHEHEAILMALSILDRIAADAKGGEAAPQDIAAFIGFLREFADTCHHGKEEGLLFPALLAAGLPAEGGPVAVMLSEHAHGRELVGQMAQAADADAFAAAAAAYGAHMRQHIDKENNVLFVMADQMIPAETLASLHAAFEQHEEKVMGHGRHEELHAMLKELKRKYLD